MRLHLSQAAGEMVNVFDVLNRGLSRQVDGFEMEPEIKGCATAILRT